MKSNDRSCVIILNAMRRPAGIDVIANLQQGRSLVLIAGNQPSVLVVSKRDIVHQCWKIRCLRQIVRANGMEVVAAVLASGRVVETKVTGLILHARLALCARCRKRAYLSCVCL